MKPETACIAIDIGNSRARAVQFEGREIIARTEFEPALLQESGEGLSFFSKGLPMVLSSVRTPDPGLHAILSRQGPLLVVTGSSEVPFTVEYESRDSLGSDRLALVAGAIADYPGRDMLIVDAGTCITTDLVLGGVRYLGGSISPGIRMRLRAMHEFTSRLPEAPMGQDIRFPGKNTLESLMAGGIEGALLEIVRRTELLQQQYPGLSVIITGGDAPYFVKNLKNSIFASPDLVLLGLRMILEYYVRKNK